MIPLPFTLHTIVSHNRQDEMSAVYKSINTKWSGSDTEERFLDAKKYIKKYKDVFGVKEWYYSNEEVISYYYNDFGIRDKRKISKDFDFSEYTVILGCSHIEGIGIPVEHTIPMMYEKLTSEPTINWGLGGASNEVIYHNLCWLLTRKNKPKKIIVVWSYYHRQLLASPMKVKDPSEDKRITLNYTTGVDLSDLHDKEIKKYVKPEFFTEQSVLKSCIYFDMVQSFKEENDITEINIFGAPHPSLLQDNKKNILPEYIIKRYIDDFTFWNEESKKISINIYSAIQNNDLSNVISKYYARDVIISNYNAHPSKIMIGGHYGRVPNAAITRYIIKKSTS